MSIPTYHGFTEDSSTTLEPIIHRWKPTSGIRPTFIKATPMGTCANRPPVHVLERPTPCLKIHTRLMEWTLTWDKLSLYERTSGGTTSPLADNLAMASARRAHSLQNHLSCGSDTVATLDSLQGFTSWLTSPAPNPTRKAASEARAFPHYLLIL